MAAPRCSRIVGCVSTIGLFFFAATARAEDTARTLFAFDEPTATNAWVAVNGLPLVLGTPPEAAAANVGPSGTAAHLKAAAAGGLYAKRDATPLDWTKVRTVTFWAYRSAEAAAAGAATPIEVQFVEADGKTRFWRKIDLNHAGWKQYEVPLRWCRWSQGRIPQWSRVVRIGFWCREAGEFWIDDVAVIESTEADAAELSAEELRDFAFPGAGAKARLEKGKSVTLITDIAELDAPQLAAHLDKAVAAVAADMPFLGETQAGRIVLFADRTAYQQFTVRTAEKLNSAAQPPTSGGFTFWGIATSFWDPAYGTLRPVYLHEFVHSYLDSALQLDNSGEWLHEGMASHYQLRFHPQGNFGEIVRNGISDPGNFQPLETLLNGKKIELNAYWQAATLVDMLLHDDAYRPKLPGLFNAFREAGSTDLGPQLQTYLGKTFEELTADWQAFCKRTY